MVEIRTTIKVDLNKFLKVLSIFIIKIYYDIFIKMSIPYNFCDCIFAVSLDVLVVVDGIYGD